MLKIKTFLNKNKNILSFWLKYKKNIIVIQLLELGSVCISSVTPSINTLIFDKGIGERNIMVLVFSVGLYLTLGLLQTVLSYIINKKNIVYRCKYEKDLKTILLNRFLMSENEYTSAEVDVILTEDTANFISLFSDNLISILYSFVKFLIYFIIMIYLNYKLTLLNLILLFSIIIYELYKAKERKKQSYDNHDIFIGLARTFNEIIRYIKDIIRIDGVKYANETYSKAIDERNVAIKKTNKISQKDVAFRQISNILTECMFLGLGGYFIVLGKLSLGQLIAFMGYSALMYTEFCSIIETYGSYMSNRKSVEIISKELQFEAPKEIENIKKVSEIELCDFSFKYKDSDEFIFSNVNLKLTKNKINYLIGKSGIGKTTLTKCIIGSIKDYTGEVLFDGNNYNETYSTYNKFIAWVPQYPIIFSDTILNNICLSHTVNMDEIKRYCIMCQIYDEITNLPDQFNTIIGDAGVELSGGQKQRLSIVRALVQNKPIMILDEITSGIDHKSAIKIKESLKKISRGKLVIIITHDIDFIIKKSAVFEIAENNIQKIDD